ncbi:hypothetical protein GCM10009730_38340 [Streptomyces albidochromogenes]
MYEAVADAAACAGEARPTMAARGTTSAVRPAAALVLKRVRRGVCVLKGAPKREVRR